MMLVSITLSCQKWPPAPSILASSREKSTLKGAFCKRLFSYTDDWHTEFRIQYFANSNHCIHNYEMLEGEEKRQAAESRLDEFEADMQDPDAMTIEDYSPAGPVDEPPIDGHLYCANMDDKS
jgi:hypothetical protein